MPDVLFYHLERAGLDDVLPGLLERTRERGWKALVRVSSKERAEALDNHLWTYKEDSFLAHALERDQRANEQPILVTTKKGNPNTADVIFFADGATPEAWSDPELSAYKRVVLLFDGRDPLALDSAREQWKQARASGLDITYWQQSDTGKWEKRA